MSRINKVALVGASGNLGKYIAQYLLELDFEVTALSRPNSKGTYQSGLKKVDVDFTSVSDLTEALKGHDALVITLSAAVPPDMQTKLIDAAASAGVPYVLPNEYGSDSANRDMAKHLFIFAEKAKYIEHIEEVGKSSWIGVINGLWYDFAFEHKIWGMDPKDPKVELVDNGANKFSTATLPQVGRAIAKLLALPEKSQGDGKPALEDYKNKFVYVESFYTTQREILTAVQKASGTSDADWTIDNISAEDMIKRGHERSDKNPMDWSGAVDILKALNLGKGYGGDYHDRAINKAIALEHEDLDTVTAAALKLEATSKYL